MKYTQSFAVIVLLLFVTSSLFAAPAGRIEGVVTDNSSGDFLLAANVFIKGTSLGSATDRDGYYRIANVPPGQYVLVVDYIGYEMQEIEISVETQTTLRQDVAMVASILAVEGVEITAQRQGQAAAINQQITSDQIVNVVSEERIQELPDANAAEAISRLPGVSVRRDGGEAQKVLIRGLDAKFSTITLNGVQVPATNRENRDVDLSVISQSALVGIEVYKALTPDMDADAIAGTVNLVTGKARDERRLQFDAVGGYNGLNEKANQYNFYGRYSNRFWGKRFGIQGAVQAERRDRSSESYIDRWSVPNSTTYEISELEVGYVDEVRKRWGGELTFDWNTGDQGHIRFVNLYSNTSRDRFLSNRDYTSPRLSGLVTYIGEATDQKIHTLNNSLIGEHYFGGFDVNWILSHAYTKNDSPFDFYMRFYEYKSADSGMRDISDPDSLRLPGKNLIPYAFNNFDRSAVERTYFYQNDNDDRNLVGSLDLTRNYRLSSALAGFLKVGYKFRGKTRHRNSSQWIGPYWLRTSLPNIMLEDGTIVPKDWSQTSWPGGYDGLIGDYLGGAPYLQRDIADDYLLYPLFNEDLVREWYNANRTGISTNGQQHEYVELLIGNRDRYRVEEQINAAYLMTKLNFGQFASIIAGVRYEDEHNTYKAKYVPRITGFLESQNGVITDTTTVFEKGEWLPNFHLRLKPMQWWDIRLAATRTLARPDFQMRLPALYVNNQDQEIQQRDPFLKNAKAWNYDASMSLYTSRYGLLTVSGFRKKVDDIFYWLNDIVVLTTALADSLGLPPEYGPYPQYSLDKPVNTDDSKVWGWEVDLQTNLSFLPGLFQNIVFNANYTKIESETTYPRFRLEQPPGFPPRPPVPVFYQTIREMEGQVDHIGNIAIGYDQGGFSGRLSVYFQGSYLDAISTFERLDQYRKSFQRWDISLKQQILRNVVLFMNINNLTNTVEGSRLRFNNLDMGGIRNGMTVDMGLRVTL